MVDRFSEPARFSGAAAQAGRATPEETQPVRFHEAVIRTEELAWVAKSLEGLAQRMLWRDDAHGTSIALVRFAAGSGVPTRHAHASNQFMYCLSGRYRYTDSGVILTPGSFYWNPKGCEHGPTVADEDSVLLEIYDGPHYAVQPSWYTDPEDAR